MPQSLAKVPGKETIGIDGHKDGKKRHVETITRMKCGISAFEDARHMGTERTTGENLAKIVQPLISPHKTIAVVADNTGNNTGAQTGLFAILNYHHPWLICLGCCVHVLDLLIEDLAKLPKVARTGADAHFLVTFVKKHGILFEEFMVAQTKTSCKLELVLFPSTRFAYIYLMCQRVAANMAALYLVSGSPVFQTIKLQLKKRGKDGEKALKECDHFEELVINRKFKAELIAATSLLEPFSIILHDLEGDGVPVSHIYPAYQLMYDFTQNLDEYEDTIGNLLTADEDRNDVNTRTRERWLGSSRKVGLRNDVHLCAFLLDPMVQASLTSSRSPDCDLLGGEIQEAARRVFSHAAGDDPAKAQVFLQQLTLYTAACPTKLAGMDEAQPMGNNAYSSLVFSQMTAVWRLKAKREADRASKEGQVDEDAPGFAIKEMLGQIQLTEMQPSQFWLAMARETPRGASGAAIEAHKLFCKAAGDICSIVAHTCGVERAGKGYGLVLSPLRKKKAPERARKCIYTLQNYPLLDAKQQRGDKYQDFLEGLLTEEERAAAQAREAKVIRRGSLIIDDAPLPDSDNSESDDEPATRPTAIKWTVPKQSSGGSRISGHVLVSRHPGYIILCRLAPHH